MTVTLPTSTQSRWLRPICCSVRPAGKGGRCEYRRAQVATSIYYTTAGGYLTRPFSQDIFAPVFSSLAVNYRTYFIPHAYIDETHWGDRPGAAASNALLTQAVSATDPSRAEQFWMEVQTQQFNEGGIIAWGNADFVDAVGNDDFSLDTSAAGNLNNFRFAPGWLSRT